MTGVAEDHRPADRDHYYYYYYYYYYSQQPPGNSASAAGPTCQAGTVPTAHSKSA